MAIAYARESRAPRSSRFAIRPPGVQHPIFIRTGTSDIRAFDQIFARREVAFDLLQTPRVIVDAGANIGLASIAFAVRYPDAQIIALELDAKNFELLCENTKNYPNITPLHCGLWSHSARLEIANPEAEAWAFRGSEAGEISQPGLSVEALGVVDVMERFALSGIDLLKIDIEGGELEVFGKGSEKWLDKVRALAVELHDHWVPGCSTALNSAIGSRGCRIDEIGEYRLIQFDSRPNENNSVNQ